MLEAAVAAGIAAAGGEALLGGVLPTPAAPLLVRRHGYDLGIVLSASHNPYQDNGIKFFGGDGYKLDDATELEIEGLIETHPPAPRVGCGAAHRRRARPLPGGAARALRRARPARRAGRARLRERRHLQGRAEDLPPPRRRRDADGGRARRPQHQRRLRVHAPRPRARRARRPRRGLRLRRRRRPRARGRPHRRRRRRRRADRARRHPPRRGGRRRDRHDQLRLPPGDAGARHRGRHDAGRRPLRARGAARARLAPRRRAVRPHHRHRLRAVGRRHRRRAAGDGGARGLRPARASRDGEAPADAGQRPGPDKALAETDAVNAAVATEAPRSGVAGGCCCARAAPSRSCA